MYDDSLVTCIEGWLMKDWCAPVYGSFKPKPCVVEHSGWQAHDFKCEAKGCGAMICCYLDMKDAKLTGNLRRHTKGCWGVEVVNTMDKAKKAMKVCKKIAGKNLHDGSITAAFEWNGKGKINYSHRAHMQEETQEHSLTWYHLVLRLFVGYLRICGHFQWWKTVVSEH